MLMPVRGITYKKTVSLIIGTNKCRLWYYQCPFSWVPVGIVKGH